MAASRKTPMQIPTTKLSPEDNERAHKHMVDFLQEFNHTKEEADLITKRLKASGMNFFMQRLP